MKKMSPIYIAIGLIILSAFPLITDQAVNGEQSGTVWYFYVGIVLFLAGLFLVPAIFLVAWIKTLLIKKDK